MRVTILEGTVDEIVEYERRISDPSKSSAGSADPTVAAVSSAGDATEAAATSGVEAFDHPDPIQRFLDTRGSGNRRLALVRRYLGIVDGRGTAVEPGTSKTSPDGLSPYLMIRDAGPRRFGAVVYLYPSSGDAEFRLKKEDVADIVDKSVVIRGVKADNNYQVSCTLKDDASVDLLVTLTERALAKVRGPR
jgi:hypothetical protein